MEKLEKQNEALSALINSHKKENIVLEYPTDDDTIVEIEVKPSLSFKERASIVRDILDTIYIENENGIPVFEPALLEFAKRYAIVSYYTAITLPTDTEELWTILNATPLYDDIIKAVGESQILAIFKDVKLAIDQRTFSSNRSSKIDSIINKIFEFINMATNKISSMSDEELLDSIKNIFGNVDPQVLNNILKSAGLNETNDDTEDSVNKENNN